MDNRPSDERARNRWALIQLARTGGVALAILGLLIAEGAVGGPGWLGYLMLAVGLAGVFGLPIVLARRWRSPPP